VQFISNPSSSFKHRRLAGPLVALLAIFGGGYSAPAVACLCSCSLFSTPAPVSGVDTQLAGYDQIFSGVVIGTERVDAPADPPAPSDQGVVVAERYWIRTRILVLRTWRGTPSAVAELWIPVFTNCDSPPIPGSYFVALVRTDEDRNVAGSSLCDCGLRAAATAGRATYSMAGVAITSGMFFVVAFALYWMVRRFRRGKRG
jgi:hypothetical protein